MSLRTRSTFDNTSNTAQAYPPLGQDEKSFSKSKSICVSTWRKSPWIRTIWTPPGGRKRGRLCFIKRKDKRYISNNRNFKQKKISLFFDEKEQVAKTSGLFLESSLVLCFSSLVSAESRNPFPRSPPAAVSHTRRHARERTRTGASRTQRLCISCLHPSPPHPTL